MARWLAAWLEYYKRLWWRGVAMVLVGVTLSAALGSVAFVLVNGLGWLLGWSEADTLFWFKVSGLLWLPLVVGSVVTSSKFRQLDSPPAWWAHKRGVSLPAYDPHGL